MADFMLYLLPVILLLLLVNSILLLVRKPQDVDFSQTDAALIKLGAQLDAQAQAAAQAQTGLRTEFATNRQEMGSKLEGLAETVRRFGIEQREGQEKVATTLDVKVKELREENTKKLDEMRKTVDEHLQTALEKRLTESFKTVSEQLNAVHKGLGEMQNLATGVGDLKRVLTNVKARGTFGEGQLETLIADMLTTDQYEKNFDCGKKGSRESVEFAVRMPGGGDRAVYLPIDAKFPREDYDRLLDAVDAGDRDAVEAASKALETRVKSFAKDVSSKYVNPPTTTDWAVLFLPTEGLYAECLRRPGLFEALQRDYRITLAGPTNVQVLLSTIRMGFQQLALNERAHQVWEVLGAVKKEFGTYGGQVEAMRKSLGALDNHITKLETRHRAMGRALKNVEESNLEITDET